MRRAASIDEILPNVAPAGDARARSDWQVVAAPVALGLALTLLRLQFGSGGILTQYALTTLALVSRVSASALRVGNVVRVGAREAGGQVPVDAVGVVGDQVLQAPLQPRPVRLRRATARETHWDRYARCAPRNTSAPAG